MRFPPHTVQLPPTWGRGLRRTLALAAGGLREAIGLPAAALGVDAQLFIGLLSQAVRELGRLGADLGQTSLTVAAGGRQLTLGCIARIGEDPFRLFARVAHDRRRALLG